LQEKLELVDNFKPNDLLNKNIIETENNNYNIEFRKIF
jgi:hypothetical protein